MITPIQSPAPQWTEPGTLAGASATRLQLVLDGDGFYRIYGGVTPTGYFEDDGTGVVTIVTSTPTPMRIARNPSGMTIIY